MTNNNALNGNGISSASTDKDSLTPSPPNRLNDDVKSEPMELVCGNHNLPSDDQSNDSVGDSDGKYLGGVDGKGSLRYVSHSIQWNVIGTRFTNECFNQFNSAPTTMTISKIVYTHTRHRHF